MNDLIWIGNTIYPREVVYLALGLVVVALAGLLVALTPKDEKRS